MIVASGVMNTRASRATPPSLEDTDLQIGFHHSGFPGAASAAAAAGCPGPPSLTLAWVMSAKVFPCPSAQVRSTWAHMQMPMAQSLKWLPSTAGEVD